MDKIKLKGLENYVVLEFAEGTWESRVVDANHAMERYGDKLEININPHEETWSFNPNLDSNEKPKRYSIGNSRPDARTEDGGIIGVYDKRNTGHLGSMVRVWGEITRGLENPFSTTK